MHIITSNITCSPIYNIDKSVHDICIDYRCVVDISLIPNNPMHIDAQDLPSIALETPHIVKNVTM